ncbi:MAG TPA: hypothetical protein VFV81_05475, partial [Verrucomicrobiae bacterium]|nr:hypothetical protein [Verrucomicrobiae bacterium]
AKDKLNYFNIGTAGTATTVKFIAETVVKKMAPAATIRYTGGDRGWVGDVPRVSYSIEKLKKLGWTPKMSSNKAVERAVDEIVGDLKP